MANQQSAPDQGHKPTAHQVAKVSANGRTNGNGHKKKRMPSVLEKKLKSLEWPMVSTAILVLVAGILFFLLEIERGKFSTARQDLVTKKQEKQVSDTVEKDDIAMLDDAFLTDDDVVDFIQRLEKGRSAFSSFDLSFTSETPQGKQVKYLTFELRLEGPVVNMSAFLDALIESSYVFEVVTLEILSKEGFSGDGMMTLVGNIYISDL